MEAPCPRSPGWVYPPPHPPRLLPVGTRPHIDLYPEPLRARIDELNAWIYADVCNGAYKAGFTGLQDAYERAYVAYFRGFERLNAILADSRFLCGESVTEADLRLFPTVFRHGARGGRGAAGRGVLKCACPPPAQTPSTTCASSSRTRPRLPAPVALALRRLRHPGGQGGVAARAHEAGVLWAHRGRPHPARPPGLP